MLSNYKNSSEYYFESDIIMFKKCSMQLMLIQKFFMINMMFPISRQTILKI